MSVDIAYATDEDIYIRVGADFLLLAPENQKVAQGTDGQFLGSDRWNLRSTSNDFFSQKVVAGMICQLEKRGEPGSPSPFSANGEAMAIDGTSSLTPHELVLRRVGLVSGEGLPPGPALTTTGIKFTVPTMRPQIIDASYRLNQIFGVNGIIDVADFADIREVRDACILMVISERYARVATEGDDSRRADFTSKGEALASELADVKSRLVIHWEQGLGYDPSWTFFSTRLARA